MTPPVGLARPVQGHRRPTASNHICAFSYWSRDFLPLHSSYSSLLMLPDPHLPREDEMSLERIDFPNFPVARSPTRCEPVYSVQAAGVAVASAVPQQFLSVGA